MRTLVIVLALLLSAGLVAACAVVPAGPYDAYGPYYESPYYGPHGYYGGGYYYGPYGYYGPGYYYGPYGYYGRWHYGPRYYAHNGGRRREHR